MWSSQKVRRGFAALLFLSLAFAAALSASPQLHEWLHKSGDGTTHECAATLMSSGSVEHSACQPVFTPPTPTPTAPAFRAQRFARVLAFLGSSLLEHAPPAHA